METRGTIEPILADVSAVIDWLEYELERDTIETLFVIQTNEERIILDGPVIPPNSRASTSVSLGVSAHITNLSGERKLFPGHWVLWFLVRPLLRGEVKLEWVCRHQAVRVYLEELLGRFRKDFKLQLDAPMSAVDQDNPSTTNPSYSDDGGVGVILKQLGLPDADPLDHASLPAAPARKKGKGFSRPWQQIVRICAGYRHNQGRGYMELSQPEYAEKFGVPHSTFRYWLTKYDEWLKTV